MTFTDDDFIEILNYCKDLTNFHENAKVSYDNIVNVSDSLIEDSRFWLFNFDNICENIYTKSNGRRVNLPSSTDGLDFIIGSENNTLYLIEFKNVSLHSTDYKNELKSIKMLLNNKHCYYQQEFCPINSHTLKSLDNIRQYYEDERICKLKLKTNESLFFILPKLFEHYKNNCHDFNKTPDEFIAWLLKLNKRFILVFANDHPNIPNDHFSFENKLKNNYKHFEKIGHIKTSIIKKKDFEDKFLDKFEFIRDC